MNEYSRAWNKIITELTEKNYTVGKFLAKKESILIQKLVERATPKKVVLNNDNVESCPECDNEVIFTSIHGITFKEKYCDECGQQLYWRYNK